MQYTDMDTQLDTHPNYSTRNTGSKKTFVTNDCPNLFSIILFGDASGRDNEAPHNKLAWWAQAVSVTRS